MDETQPNISIKNAEEFLRLARELINTPNRKEQSIRDVFTSYLPAVFPDRPYWVRRHIEDSESTLSSTRGENRVSVFVDNLVDNTAIEYETDLRNYALFQHGRDQVREYCAGLINQGSGPEIVTGILSDTLQWHAYSIQLTNDAAIGQLESNQIILTEIDSINLHEYQIREGILLVNFLLKHLGRQGARHLSAENIARDLGLRSIFYSQRYENLIAIAKEAFSENQEFAEIVVQLWESFVSYLNPDESEFNLSTYVSEFYITTLAKMICANALSGMPLNSPIRQIKRILLGDYFSEYQIDNMVEHDYFRWLLEEPYLSKVAEIASDMQEDLLAYSYDNLPENTDLFGPLMVQLADQTRRILLGQEWTPYWLTKQMAIYLFENLPYGENPRFLDPCCGSGAFLSSVLEISKNKLSQNNVNPDELFHGLIQSIVGFDIDPVAVMLSKITWILGVKEHLSRLTSPMSIPVYHADSLFLVTPLEREPNVDFTRPTKILLDGEYLELPQVLLKADKQLIFDSLIEEAYSIALRTSELAKISNSDSHDLDLDKLSLHFTNLEILASFNETDKVEVTNFITKLTERLTILELTRRDGIWAYVIKNSYRPVLMAGNFNGVISNPPWLTMSKLGNNPYRQATEGLADSYAIKPKGSSFPHLELSTLFIMHSLHRYLGQDGMFAFVVPQTILNGNHHNPFREITGPGSTQDIRVSHIWEVGIDTFKNKAAVIFGRKSTNPENLEEISGAYISETRKININWFWTGLGQRAIWSKDDLNDNNLGNIRYYDFHQGADILPRKLFSVDFIEETGGKVRIQSIDVDSQWHFAVKDAKPPYDQFTLQGNNLIEKSYLFRTLFSKHLSPFHIVLDQAVWTVAPIKRESNVWRDLSNQELVLLDRSTNAIFNQMKQELIHLRGEDGRSNIWIDNLNYRNKLSRQVFPDEGFLIFTGAGGGILCSAYINLENVDATKLLIDQTLYWNVVDSEAEAIYLTGIFNSQAINSVIANFIPQGKFGGRHLHTLPFIVTPEFDNEEEKHINVVEATSTLIAELYTKNDELDEFIDKQVVFGAFDASLTLTWRRRKIREFIKTKLNSYTTYENACHKLFNIPYTE